VIIATRDVIFPDDRLINAGSSHFIARCAVSISGCGVIIAAGDLIIAVYDSAHVRRSLARPSQLDDRLCEPAQWR
jgi:hypothetical protein